MTRTLCTVRVWQTASVLDAMGLGHWPIHRHAAPLAEAFDKDAIVYLSPDAEGALEVRRCRRVVCEEEGEEGVWRVVPASAAPVRLITSLPLGWTERSWT